jgi:hypothetical protein
VSELLWSQGADENTNLIGGLPSIPSNMADREAGQWI